MKRLAACLAAVCALAGCATDTTTAIHVAGRVLDGATGQPLPNTRVEMWRPGGFDGHLIIPIHAKPKKVVQTVTGADGHYDLQTPNRDVCWLMVWHDDRDKAHRLTFRNWKSDDGFTNLTLDVVFPTNEELQRLYPHGI